jgi:hypothetical protein
MDNEPVSQKDGVAVLRTGHKVDLSCTSESGNPVTSLSFTKNGNSFGPQPISHKNTHTFQVTPEDNGALLGCLSQNDDDWQSKSEALRLHVLFPPERLSVEGPDELTPEYNARFTCKASASNLPSKLTFKLTSHHNDLLEEFINSGLVEIEEHKEKWIENEQHNQGAPGWASSRSLVLKTDLLKKAAELGEHITFECQIPDPYHERRILISATKFVTLYNPIPAVELKLKVSGPSEVRYNEAAQFRCDSNREDIEFTMSLDKKNMKNAFTSEELILQPGQLEHGTNQFEIECFGIDENDDKVTISHIVNVLYPPSMPEITPVKAVVTPGNEQKLTCVSKAGNPTAKLNWYRGTQMIESLYTIEGDMVKAEVTFVAKPEDNGSELRCEATNSASSKPVSETITIELLPESSTSAKPIETEKVVNHEDEEYYGYDESDDYYSNEVDSPDGPYAHPEAVDYPTIFGGKRKVQQEVPQKPDTVNTVKQAESKTPEKPSVSHPNEVYPKTNPLNAVPFVGSNSPATLSLSLSTISCLLLAFLLNH